MENVLSFRCSDEEAERIRNSAARLGMTVSDYLRRAALPPVLNHPIGGVTITHGATCYPTTVSWKAA